MLARLLETRATLRDPARWMLDWLGGPMSASGQRVSPDTVTQLTAFYAGVNFLAKTVASLPLITYRRLPGRGKDRAPEHPLYILLHDQPNPWQTSFEFREMLQGHLCLRGNAYAEIVSAAGRAVDALIPLHPDRVRPFWVSPGVPAYEYTPLGGTKRLILGGEMLHVRFRTDDGLTGISPITACRESLGLGLATQDYAGRLFANDARPGGVLTHPGKLTPEAAKKLKASWQEAHAGPENAHKTAVLEEGLKWEQIGLKAHDAQLLESRKFTVTEIARVLDLPPHILKDLERSTFSNIEHQAIELVVHSLRPWFVRWEQCIQRDLMLPKDKTTFFVEFLVDALLRGDATARGDFYTKLFNMAAISPNEIRSLENMNPRDGGDAYFVPLNLVPSDQAGEPPTSDAGVRAQPSESRIITISQAQRAIEQRARTSKARQRIRSAYRRLFKDAGTRLVTKEVKAVRGAVKKFLAGRAAVDLERWLNEFYKDHAGLVTRGMLPALMAYAEALIAEAGREIGNEDLAMTPAIEQQIRDYAQALGLRQAGSSRGQLLQLLRDPNETDMEDALETRLGEWEEKRPDKIADRETVQAGGAFITFAFLAAGVQRLMWQTTDGDQTCPLCQELDGKIVGIATPFVRQGDTVTPGGDTAPLTSDGDIGHEPLHEGCNCITVAV